MKLNNVKDIDLFVNTVNACEKSVWLTNHDDATYDLKSVLSMYLAIAKLIGGEGDRFELFCDSREDEARFIDLFCMNPQMIA